MPDDLPRVPRGLNPDYKKNRPRDSQWRQQTLPAYRPLLSARCALPITFFGGFIFAVFGYILYHASNSAQEEIIDYTACRENTTGGNAADMLSEMLSRGSYDRILTCQYAVELQQQFTGDVYFYYGLTHFYQNIRPYVRSRNDEQLAGQLTMVEDCSPYDYRPVNGTNVPIAPCGLIANSMFNDTFSLYYTNIENDTETTVQVPFTTLDVVWSSERSKKFKNPPYPPNKTLCDMFNGTTKPPSWQKPVCQLIDEDNWAGFENTDFIVWMTPAALPTFRKLYRRLDRAKAQFAAGLPAGNYTLFINYNYPIAAFGGLKRFVIATESWAGPKRYFLGIAYMTIGLFLIFVSFLLVALIVGLFVKEKLHQS